MYQFRSNPPSRRIPQRPVMADAGAVLSAIERYLSDTSTAASRFGRRAVGDPRLVADLRGGAGITSRRAAIIWAFLAGAEHA